MDEEEREKEEEWREEGKELKYVGHGINLTYRTQTFGTGRVSEIIAVRSRAASS